MSEYLQIERPSIAGVPMTTDDVEKIWAGLITIANAGPELDAVGAILREVHFGLRQLGE